MESLEDYESASITIKVVHSYISTIMVWTWFLCFCSIMEKQKLDGHQPSNQQVFFLSFRVNNARVCTYGKPKVDCASATDAELWYTLRSFTAFTFLSLSPCSLPLIFGYYCGGLYFLATAKHSIPLGEISPLLAFSPFLLLSFLFLNPPFQSDNFSTMYTI